LVAGPWNLNRSMRIVMWFLFSISTTFASTSFDSRALQKADAFFLLHMVRSLSAQRIRNGGASRQAWLMGDASLCAAGSSPNTEWNTAWSVIRNTPVIGMTPRMALRERPAFLRYLLSVASKATRCPPAEWPPTNISFGWPPYFLMLL